MKQILLEYKHFILLFHIFGTTLGLGGAIVTDLLFMRYLKDFRVSAEEKETLDNLSWVIWTGLGILVVTGLLLFYPSSSQLLASSLFLAKMVAVSVILVNGLILNFYVSPKLTSMVFNDPALNSPSVNLARKLSPIFGGVSIISWLYTFFLGAMNSYLDYSFGILLGSYLGLLAIGILVTVVVTNVKFAKKIN